MSPAAPAGLRRFAPAVVTLLILWLPALVGGARLTDPARPGELQRLQQGLDPTAVPGPISWPLTWFYAAAAGRLDSGEPDRGRPVDQRLPRARLAVVVGLLALSCLLYLLLVLTRRRTTALLACLALTVLPPVWNDGHVLRPEVPAAVFAALAMVLVVGYPLLLRRAGTALRWLSMLWCAMAMGAAIGLAGASVSRAAVLLLVPGSALVLLCGALVLSIGPIVRRRSARRLPSRAMQARLLPWVVLGLVNMLVALPVLQLSLATLPGAESIELPPSVATAGLLPAHPLLRVPVLLLALLGALRLLLAVGLRLPRLQRITPDALLLLYVAVMVAQQLLGVNDADGLMAAPALAVLVAEGGVGVLRLLLGTRR